MAAEDKITVLVVDDEPLARALIVELLDTSPDFQVVGECFDGESALEAIERLSPQLVFLDVQMPGMDGLRVLEGVEETAAPKVILVTAYDEYAVRAFDFEVVDYLLKPFTQPRFEKALLRAKASIAASAGGGHGEHHRPPQIEDRHPGSMRLRRLFVKDRGKIILLDPDRIDWIEADDKYVRIHTSEKVFMVRQTLNAVEAELDPNLFARVHRSYVVNVPRISELHPMFNGEYVLVLGDGTQLTLSRNYRERFFEKFRSL